MKHTLFILVFLAYNSIAQPPHPKFPSCYKILYSNCLCKYAVKFSDNHWEGYLKVYDSSSKPYYWCLLDVEGNAYVGHEAQFTDSAEALEAIQAHWHEISIQKYINTREGVMFPKLILTDSLIKCHTYQ